MRTVIQCYVYLSNSRVAKGQLHTCIIPSNVEKVVFSVWWIFNMPESSQGSTLAVRSGAVLSRDWIADLASRALSTTFLPLMFLRLQRGGKTQHPVAQTAGNVCLVSEVDEEKGSGTEAVLTLEEAKGQVPWVWGQGSLAVQQRLLTPWWRP